MGYLTVCDFCEEKASSKPIEVRMNGKKYEASLKVKSPTSMMTPFPDMYGKDMCMSCAREILGQMLEKV
jgi:hypothetical protein